MRWPTLLWLAICGVGCDGLAGLKLTAALAEAIDPAATVEDAANPNGPGPEGVVLDAASSSLRRLTRTEYLNTVQALLGLSTLSVELANEPGDIFSLLAAEKLDAAAEALVARGAHRSQLPCPASGDGSQACVEGYLKSFGRLAFRRPLTSDEQVWLLEVFRSARAQLSFSDSIDVLTRVILQAPQVVYLREVGESAEGLPSGLRRLTGYERAARLAYFLWSSAPDAALLDAAAQGSLDSAEGVRAQAERMLTDSRARQVAVRIVSDWLELDGNSLHDSLEKAQKSATMFPFDSPALRQAMRKETEALVDRVMQEDASLARLLTSKEAYVNGPLAKLYGVEGPTNPDAFQWVQLDGARRSGLFTRAAFLSVFAHPEVHSPIRRGAFLLKKVICRPLGTPPADVNDTPVMGGAEVVDGVAVRHSTRQSVELRTAGATCRSCHAVINPTGFAFEHYDALGGWRAQEPGQDPDGTAYSLPIDATGQLSYQDLAQPFTDATVFSSQLAQSATVRNCVAQRWFERAFGRPVAAAELSSLGATQRRFIELDDLRELSLSIVTSPAFLYVREP